MGVVVLVKIYLQFNTQWFKSSAPVLEMFGKPSALALSLI